MSVMAPGGIEPAGQSVSCRLAGRMRAPCPISVAATTTRVPAGPCSPIHLAASTTAPSASTSATPMIRIALELRMFILRRAAFAAFL